VRKQRATTRAGDDVLFSPNLGVGVGVLWWFSDDDEDTYGAVALVEALGAVERQRIDVVVSGVELCSHDGEKMSWGDQGGSFVGLSVLA
jgi:hypothetical protein